MRVINIIKFQNFSYLEPGDTFLYDGRIMLIEQVNKKNRSWSGSDTFGDSIYIEEGEYKKLKIIDSSIIENFKKDIDIEEIFHGIVYTIRSNDLLYFKKEFYFFIGLFFTECLNHYNVESYYEIQKIKHFNKLSDYDLLWRYAILDSLIREIQDIMISVFQIDKAIDMLMSRNSLRILKECFDEEYSSEEALSLSKIFYSCVCWY